MVRLSIIINLRCDIQHNLSCKDNRLTKKAQHTLAFVPEGQHNQCSMIKVVATMWQKDSGRFLLPSGCNYVAINMANSNNDEYRMLNNE